MNEEPAAAAHTECEQFSELLSRARKGDLAAFERIVECFERPVLMTAARLLGNASDAQDAAQEIFLRLFRYLDRFNEVRDFKPWLYRLTVNACRDLRRRRPDVLPLFEAGQVRAAADLERELGHAERWRLIEEGLKTLSEKEREAVVLRDIEGFSTTEVAAALGSSEATVRSHISHARLKLKKFVDRVQGRRS